MRGTHRELAPFLRLMRPHFRPMILGVLLGTAALAAAVGLLTLSGWFLAATAIAGVSAAGGWMFNFFFPSIGIRLFAFTRTLARYGERVISHDATFRILESLRVWFYRRIEPLAPACLARFRSGDILNRLVSDIDTLDNLFLRVLAPASAAVLVVLGLAGFLWLLDPVLALWGLVFLCTAGALLSWGAQRLGAETGRLLQQQSATLRTVMVEGLQGMAELLVYGADRTHLEHVRGRSAEMIASQRRMRHITGMFSGLTTLVYGMAVIVVLCVGLERLDLTGFGGASLPLVTLAVLAAFESVWPLPGAFQYLGRIREAGRRLLEVVDTQPAVRFSEVSAQSPGGVDVCFDNVRFIYPGGAGPVLDGLNWRAAPGQRTLILGETGSGKSTLVHLLMRFWDPDAGRICVGGADIRHLSEDDLRGRFTVVSQQAHIFSTSVRGNLLLARPEATADQLREALAAVRLLEFVDGLPDGLDTWVGEAGRRLSGGQARRLAVARAFLHDAPIWVLDEPTEGLDRTTEREVMEAVFHRTRDKTLVLISHRMFGIRQMDKVLLLDRGRIAAEGTHGRLMTENPAFRKFVSRL